ncbi:hypothetical protein ACFVSN_30995 [Kitasatospora sp. NPDC057904]|uniref:hypothetical protein n=1 Tax=Kitasatospora sp. NPDC057904 TaxID=3346275 RepID=UPI0036D9BBAF
MPVPDRTADPPLTTHAQNPHHPDHAQDEGDNQDNGLLGGVRSLVRRQATLETIEQAQHRAREDERAADRYADAGHMAAYATAADALVEWQRVRDRTAETRAERYDPDHDTALQHALCRERHRQDVAECAREAAQQARQSSDAAHRSLASTAAQPPYTALERAGLHVLTDDDHQAVRDLTQQLGPATLCQIMSWLERTRVAAFALRGTEQTPPVRPVVRRSRF